MGDAMMTSPETVIVLAQTEEKGKAKPKFELQLCELVANSFADDAHPSNVPHSLISIYPAEFVKEYLSELSGGKEEIDMSGSKITIVDKPRYATLEPYKENNDPRGQGFIYSPQPKEWVGADQLTALVEFNDQIIQVRIDIVVVKGIDDRNGFADGFSGGGEALDAIANECRRRGYRRDGVPIFIDGEEEIGDEGEICYIDLANWYYTISLQALLTGAKDTLAGFTNLCGTVLGQMMGDRITLDTNAAGSASPPFLCGYGLGFCSLNRDFQDSSVRP
jgi:hypothetical protein